MYHRLVICTAVVSAVSGCSKEGGAVVAKDNQSIQVGGLYATQNNDGSWRVTKVLAVDDFAVHLRSYANKFQEQPRDIDPNTLSLGGLNEPGGCSIGHFPLAKEGFLKANRVLIKVIPVKDEELEGYKIYLEAMKDNR